MNKYEMVLIAAREARRLNELAKLSGRELKNRPTDLAWGRLGEGKIQFTYEVESFDADAPAAAPAPELPADPVAPAKEGA